MKLRSHTCDCTTAYGVLLAALNGTNTHPVYPFSFLHRICVENVAIRDVSNRATTTFPVEYLILVSFYIEVTKTSAPSMSFYSNYRVDTWEYALHQSKSQCVLPMLISYHYISLLGTVSIPIWKPLGIYGFFLYYLFFLNVFIPIVYALYKMSFWWILCKKAHQFDHMQ